MPQERSNETAILHAAIDARDREIDRLKHLLRLQDAAMAAIEGMAARERQRAEAALADLLMWQRRLATWQPRPTAGTYLNRKQDAA